MKIFEIVFGCRHTELSRVFTIGGQSYCVCWTCGSRFSYSLASMRMGRRFADVHEALPARSA
ncbi:MAG TPA: hypothetical protein VHE33_15975 [Acidobacteriaceae bacterium]|nr:hypothetical protein [Acidobacteriaceae bacterium]